MPFLLACSGVTPSLALPVGPPAEHAEPLALASLLTPTAFGASDDVLCPWARGDPVASATIPRWLAEGRLTWRVLHPDEPATFAGRPLAEEDAVHEAILALEERCGADRRPRKYLIAATATTPSGVVLRAMYGLPYEEPWCLVSDLTPGPAPPPRVALEVPEPGALNEWAELLENILGGGGSAPLPGEGLEAHMVVVRDPPRVLGSEGPLNEPWSAWLARAGPPEISVVAPDRAPWGKTVAVVDAAQGLGSAAVLGTFPEDEADGWPVTGRVAGDRAEQQVPWNASVAALPISPWMYR